MPDGAAPRAVCGAASLTIDGGFTKQSFNSSDDQFDVMSVTVQVNRIAAKFADSAPNFTPGAQPVVRLCASVRRRRGAFRVAAKRRIVAGLMRPKTPNVASVLERR